MSSKTSVSEIFDIPKFYYFDSGNDYSGSKGDFSYKIITSESFTALTWHGKLCSEKATIENRQDFPRTEQGFGEMIKWIEQKYSE